MGETPGYGQYATAGLGLATSILAPSGGENGAQSLNGLKYTSMGSQLLAINPIAGGIGTGVGLIADLMLGADAQRTRNDQVKKRYEESMLNYSSRQDNPYANRQQLSGQFQGGVTPMMVNQYLGQNMNLGNPLFP